MDVATIGSQFPILRREVNGRPLVYLDNAATSQKPQAVLDAMNRHWAESNANIHRGVHTLSQEATAEYERARGLARVFLNAADDREIIFTKGCTDAINLVASSLSRGSGLIENGQTILLSAMEHHSNIVPWQMAAEAREAGIQVIPIFDDGTLDLDWYTDRLRQGGVAVVGVNHVSNAVGTINPVKEMIRLAHEAGALALIDGAQAAPHLSIDVQDLEADFYTVSGHKMYGPTGTGLLYGKRALLEAMPPYQGGGDMIRTVSFEKSTYADLPAKFEAGTPNVAGVIGLGAAIEWLSTLAPTGDPSEIAGSAGVPPTGISIDLLRSDLIQSVRQIGQHERALASEAATRLSSIPGVRIFGNPSSGAGIVSFVMDQAHPHDIGTILDAEGVAIRAGHHCCMPLMKRLGVPATARASFAAYNTMEEVEVLVSAVQKVAEMFA